MEVATTFLDLPQTPLEAAEVILLPLPYDGTASYGKGTANGPAAVVEASTQVELWDEELDFDLDRLSFHIAEAVSPAGASPATYVDRVLAAGRDLRRRNRAALVVGIGGEHSVTPPLVRAAAVNQNDLSGLSVVQFDAHADLRNEYGGTPVSHACAMRRLVELGAYVLSVGIRSADRDEFAYGKSTERVETYFAQGLATDREAHDQLRARLSSLVGDVYLTIDIDCLEVLFCPGTGTPQPGGLGWWQILAFLRSLLYDNRSMRLIGCDVVETVPQPNTHVNEFTAAKLLGKIFAYYGAGRA